MFDTKLPKPRGFFGRPLIALLFAVVIGNLAYYGGLWFHTTIPAMVVVVLASVVIVGYLWHRAEKPK
jgi:Na+-translocating ferredoxin:NAD+ oxidoreductase RnfD subunit